MIESLSDNFASSILTQYGPMDAAPPPSPDRNTMRYYLFHQPGALPAIPIRVTYNADDHAIAAEIPDGEGKLAINNDFWARTLQYVSSDCLTQVTQPEFEAALSVTRALAGRNVVTLFTPVRPL